MPSPAPSGADIADDMHDSTLMPYISDAIGFFSAFIANVSCALMSTSSQVPSGRDRAAQRLHHLERVRHVVDAVERRDEPDRPVVGQRFVARIVERHVGRARGLAASPRRGATRTG